jgi:glycosyltransferase involved in cell wall biosynthesis
VRREAAGLPVDVLLNADFATLNEELARASIYWHATGFGVDLDRFPERAEHFGIAPVEAMSTGAIPILYAAGGPREVVREGVEGFLFSTEDELIAKTLSVMNMAESERGAFRTAAINRARDFSGERFATELLRHIEDILEIDTSTRPVFAHE